VPDHEQASDRRQNPLAGLIAAAQRRWGLRALTWGAGRIAPSPALPTGLLPLDALLHGGLPRGRLTEFLGTPTSGMTTIALMALAHTQARGELAAWFDLRATFDAAYAAACGVDLPALLLVRPPGVIDALELAEALLTSGGVGLVVIDALARTRAAGERALASPALRRLLAAIAPHPGALLALTPLPAARARGHDDALHSPLAQPAALRLHVARQTWEDNGAAPACSVRITVLKRRGGTDGAATVLPLTFPADWEFI